MNILFYHVSCPLNHVHHLPSRLSPHFAGNSIYQFLQRALEQLRKEFNELRAATADHLMYIKEDLIIPHHNTFYDFIVNKVREVGLLNPRQVV